MPSSTARSPLLPLARVGAAAIVAAAAVVGAKVAQSGKPAPAEGSASPQPSGNLAVATATAQQLIAGFAVPPGAVRLGGAPIIAVLPPSSALTRPAYSVTRTGWWSTDQRPQQALDWIDGHLEHGLTLRAAPASVTGYSSAWSAEFSGAGASRVIDGVTVYVYAYATAGGSALEVDASVAYPPEPPKQELIPPAAMLIVVPQPASGTAPPPEEMVSDRATIARVAGVINTLRHLPETGLGCPPTGGGSVALVFEDERYATLADVVLHFGDCTGAEVTISGYAQPALASSAQTVAQIEALLGVDWKLGLPAGSTAG